MTLDDHMPIAVHGRHFSSATGTSTAGSKQRPRQHLTLADAIEKSCDVYFYQLGLKVGLTRLVAGGVGARHARQDGHRSARTKPRPLFPYADVEYYNRKYGTRGWSQAVVLNLAIGQGENSQTVVNMARFYTALATDGDGGHARRSCAAHAASARRSSSSLPTQLAGLRARARRRVSTGRHGSRVAIQGVVSSPARRARAQNTRGPDAANHAWFVGFAPADDPKIVVAVMLEFGGHGTRAARIASAIIGHYLKVDAGRRRSPTDGLMPSRRVIVDWPLVAHRAAAVGLRHRDGLLGRPDRRADRRRARVEVADRLARRSSLAAAYADQPRVRAASRVG